MKYFTKYSHAILTHLGILLIIAAMILGSFFNWRGKAVLLKEDKTNVFITKKGEIKITPFALTLSNFLVKNYESGSPKTLIAYIDVENNNNTRPITLSVNHPCKMGFGLNLYLINYNRKNTATHELCVVEMVYEPFQSFFFTGILFVIAGMIRILLLTIQRKI